MFLNGGLLLFYGFALLLLLQGADLSHRAVLLALVILIAHVLEIPLALKLLRERQPALPRLILMTTLFGFTWWLPARRGLYSVA